MGGCPGGEGGFDYFWDSVLDVNVYQEGVQEVKEVLRDAAEHLPDGHRLVEHYLQYSSKVTICFFLILSLLQ